MKKYIHIPVALLFLVSGFVFSFLFALLGFDAIISTIVSDVIMAVAGLLYMRRFFRTSSQTVSAGYVIGMSLFLVTAWLFSQITATWFIINIGDSSFDAYQTATDANILGYIVLTLVFAPISEEIVFRGILFNALKKASPVGIAYAVSGVVFALAHGTLVHMIVAIMCGVLFAVIYEHTGNLVYNIIAHMIYNGLSLFAASIPIPDLLFNPYVFGVVDVFVVGLLLFECIRVYRAKKSRICWQVKKISMPAFNLSDYTDDGDQLVSEPEMDSVF